MTHPVQVPNVSREAYQLSRMAGESHDHALEAAVGAALKEAETDLINHAAMAAGEYASDFELEKETDGDPEQLALFRAALLWYAERLLTDLPARTSRQVYVPADGDYIQVGITGDVTVEAATCRHCHAPNGCWWTVTTDTGDVHVFQMDSDVLVRKITSAGPLAKPLDPAA